MQIWMEVVIGVLVLMRSKTSAQTGYSLVGAFLDSVLDEKKGKPPLQRHLNFSRTAYVWKCVSHGAAGS